MSLPTGRGSIRLPSSSPTSPRAIVLDLFSRLTSLRTPSDIRRLLSKSYGPLPHTPLFIRPAYVLLLIVDLFFLSLLGFHPTLAGKISPPVPWWDKVLHFVGMGVATGLFYGCWRVGEEGRRGVWWWRLAPELLCAVVCLAGWGVGSEFVQSLLPYKTFQWGDVFANLLGSSLGLHVARQLTFRARERSALRQLYRPVRLNASTGPAATRQANSMAAATAALHEGFGEPTMGGGRGGEGESEDESDREQQEREGGWEDGRRASSVWSEGEEGIFGVGEEEEELAERV